MIIKMKKISLSIVIILTSVLCSFGHHYYDIMTAAAKYNYALINDTIYFKISGLNKPEDAAILDEVLLKTGLVLSANTDFQKGICKVEVVNLNYIEKIIEHIRSTWKQIGNPIDAEIIDFKENSMNVIYEH